MLLLLMGTVKSIIIHPVSKVKKQNSYWLNFQVLFTFPSKTFTAQENVHQAFVRQQNQEKDDNGKWISRNYNVFVYPLYDCNLYELHEKHFDQFTDAILGDILSKCLTRKCLNRQIEVF